MVKKVFRVADMHCSACIMRLESLEDELPGVKWVSASYQKQQMQVEFDENLVTEAQIILAVQKKGYQASAL